MKGFFDQILEVAKIVLLVMLIALPIRYFLFQPFMVRGASMEPNFQQTDYLIVDQISYRLREPQRGEVIVFDYPENEEKRHIKRIVGLPGEKIFIDEGKIVIEEDGEVKELKEDYIPPEKRSQRTGDEVFLGKDEYFVVGDNREASFDSRNWGSLSRENIVGRAFFQISFFDKFACVDVPTY